MENPQSINQKQIQEFRSAYEQNPISAIAARALSKTGMNDICYDTEHAKLMNHKFSLEVPTMAAANQKSSGRCWIFAALNILREKIAKELELESFELSQSYISFFDHLEKANTFLEHVMETADTSLDDRYVSMLMNAPLGDGGWWEYFVGLCGKYGAVPKEAMPETYQSTHSGQMNMLLNMQLRKDALMLRKAVASGKTPQQLHDMKTQMLSRVYNLLAICLGNPPETFRFEYVDKQKCYHAVPGLTPQSFYKRFIGRDLEKIVSIMNAPNLPYGKSYVTQGEESIYGAYSSKRLNLPMDALKAAVIRQLEAGEPVWFVCDCDYYGSTEQGIWDTGLYDYEALFGLDLTMEKGDLLAYRQCSLNHAMLLTGVNLVEGKPDKWKIQNSWGEEKGKKGYFIMSDSWFDRYVFTASIDTANLTPEQREQFAQQAQILPPWNVLA